MSELDVEQPKLKTPEERREILAERIAHYASRGYRVESTQGDFQAIMVRGRRPNHILHLLLSIFTLGIWLIVWLVISTQGGETRGVVKVDEYGNATSELFK